MHAHIHALHIYEYAYVKKKRRAPSPHRIPTLWQQGPTRPTRTYLSTASGADYHLNVWRPFRRAHSNLLARVRIFIKKGPRWRSSARFAPLVFLILQHRPHELRRIIIRIFKWRGGARRGEEGQDRRPKPACAHVVMIEKSIVCAHNKALTDFVSRRDFCRCRDTVVLHSTSS